MAAIGLWSVGVFAQGRNFAGSWIVDAEKTLAASINSVAGRAMGVRSGGGGAGGRGGAVTGSGGAAVGARSGGGGGGGGTTMGAGGRARTDRAAGPMTISLDATTFSIASGQTTTSYRLDGSPTTIDTPGGQSTAKATWKDDRLVIETTSDTPGGQIVRTTVWYLEAESLVRETHAPGADGQTIVRKTYFKRA